MPTRYLKPGICDSASFEAIKLPISETLYYRLLVNVDDFGRMDARASLVKSYCFPLKEKLTSDSVQKNACRLAAGRADYSLPGRW